MNCSHARRMLGKGIGGQFRPLKPGEIIEPADVVFHDTWLEGPSETSIGQPATERDRIARLEFTEKGK